MKRQLRTLKQYLRQNGSLAVAKRCKCEYIVYTYYLSKDGSTIVRMKKEYFIDRILREEKTTRKIVRMPINSFVNDTVDDLLNRGYSLKAS